MIEDFFERIVKIDSVSSSDGMGGIIEEYVEGAEFVGAINAISTNEAKIAGKVGLETIYNVTTKNNTLLKYDSVIKRVSNGQILRITSNPEDGISPKTSDLNIISYTAELYDLPII